jgi:hypothetical protein
MEKYISGEEFQRLQQDNEFPPTARQSKTKPVLLILLGLAIFAGLGFWGGVHYEKGHVKTSASSSLVSSNGNSGGYGGRFSSNGERPVIGQVENISSTSITVQNAQTNVASTFSITSSTLISDDGQAVSASDIQTGDTVLVTASSSSSSTASRIIVDPSYGSGFSGSNGSTSIPPSSVQE